MLSRSSDKGFARWRAGEVVVADEVWGVSMCDLMGSGSGCGRWGVRGSWEVEKEGVRGTRTE